MRDCSSPEAVTVAIASVTYLYVNSLIESKGEPMPSLEISKYSDEKLIVAYCKEKLEWNEDVTFTVEGNASNVTLPTDTLVKAGQIIKVGNEVDTITFVAKGYVIGSYDFF